MLMMSNEIPIAHNEWRERFLRESEENARLKADLEDARDKYASLMEVCLQQLASRDDFSSDKGKRMSPTGNNINNFNINGNNKTNNGTYNLNTSSTNLINHNNFNPLSVSTDDHGSNNGNINSTINADKKKDTPQKKKKEGIFNFGIKRNKNKERDNRDPLDGDDVRTDFVLPLAPSTSYQHLPRLQVCPLVTRKHVVLYGPSGPAGPTSTASSDVQGDDVGSAFHADIVAGRSISTYPHIPGNPNRDGDPIADRFAAHVFENRVIAAVADGCNWGPKPKEAAQKANSAFIEYVNQYHDSITDVKKAGGVLLNAFECAHNSIMEGKSAFWDAGTTTLLGGVLLEINKGTDPWTPQWEFVCASVGDCKAFCYSKTGEITDITQGNRQNASDPRDCGGRLGPHDEGKPDLRNLNLFCAPCEDGDLIIIVTDGIHDNLDPQHLGKVPKDMPKEFNLVGDKWDDVDPAKAIYAKNAYITELLLRLLKGSDDTPTPTPKEVADRLVNHCIDVTQKSRDYMENNQGKRIPEDYIEFPGKMDHTTCLCFRVGRFPSLPEKGTTTPGSQSQQYPPPLHWQTVVPR